MAPAPCSTSIGSFRARPRRDCAITARSADARALRALQPIRTPVPALAAASPASPPVEVRPHRCGPHRFEAGRLRLRGEVLRADRSECFGVWVEGPPADTRRSARARGGAGPRGPPAEGELAGDTERRGWTRRYRARRSRFDPVVPQLIIDPREGNSAGGNDLAIYLLASVRGDEEVAPVRTVSRPSAPADLSPRPARSSLHFRRRSSNSEVAAADTARQLTQLPSPPATLVLASSVQEQQPPPSERTYSRTTELRIILGEADAKHRLVDALVARRAVHLRSVAQRPSRFGGKTP